MYFLYFPAMIFCIRLFSKNYLAGKIQRAYIIFVLIAIGSLIATYSLITERRPSELGGDWGLAFLAYMLLPATLAFGSYINIKALNMAGNKHFIPKMLLLLFIFSVVPFALAYLFSNHQ